MELASRHRLAPCSDMGLGRPAFAPRRFGALRRGRRPFALSRFGGAGSASRYRASSGRPAILQRALRLEAVAKTWTNLDVDRRVANRLVVALQMKHHAVDA